MKDSIYVILRNKTWLRALSFSEALRNFRMIFPKIQIWDRGFLLSRITQAEILITQIYAELCRFKSITLKS